MESHRRNSSYPNIMFVFTTSAGVIRPPVLRFNTQNSVLEKLIQTKLLSITQLRTKTWHGIDLDPDQKHTELYCKTLAALCTAVMRLHDDSDQNKGRLLLCGSQSPGCHGNQQREECRVIFVFTLREKHCDPFNSAPAMLTA